jgi:cellulose synthase/poly-beta-1,6-N-acetylglucosamine synthase-like glycosyltransferase
MFYEVEKDNGQYQQSGEVFWASGASLFIKKKYWDEAGGFDEYFFAHMEEIDLCWRLKNMGYKVMYVRNQPYIMLAAVRLMPKIHLKPISISGTTCLLLKRTCLFGGHFGLSVSVL